MRILLPLFACCLALGPLSAEELRIPSFFNQHVDAAKKWMLDNGRKGRVVVVQQIALFPGNGIIGQQDPLAGTVLAKDTQITFYVSSGGNWNLNLDANDATIAYSVSEGRRKSSEPVVTSSGAGQTQTRQDFYGYRIAGTIGGKMAQSVELVGYNKQWIPTVIGSRTALEGNRGFSWEGVAGPNQGVYPGAPLELRIYAADGTLLAWDRLNR